MSLDIYSTPSIKNLYQVDCRSKSESSMKLLEAKTGECSHFLGVHIGFLNRAAKAIILKQKIHQRGFSSSKDASEKERVWNSICNSSIEQRPSYAKKSYKTQRQRKPNNKIWAKDDIQKYNKVAPKRYWTSLVFHEMEIKTRVSQGQLDGSGG